MNYENPANPVGFRKAKNNSGLQTINVSPFLEMFMQNLPKL